MLPNFVVIGAPKSGSTSLYHYLRHHPQVFMPDLKEPEYFLETGNWSRGRAWYESLFDPAGDAVAVGEASVRYAGHPFRPGAPQRMFDLVPEAKLIYIVREPIERMASQYVHNLRTYAERDRLTVALRKPRYLLHSSYAFQAEQFLAHFPRERLLIVQTEHLRDDPGTTLDRVFRFLGVEEGHRDPAQRERVNVTRDHVIPRPRVRLLPTVRGGMRVVHFLHSRRGRPLQRLTHVPGWTATVPDDLAAELRAELRDDVARLRGYADASFDGWGIA